MISRKLVKKLADKKYRTETGLFLVEGKKNIFELLESDFVVETVYGTSYFMNELHTTFSNGRLIGSPSLPDFVTVSEDELVNVGTLKSNNAGVAVAVQKQSVGIDHLVRCASKEIVLALDDVRDPGNLGTIIRTADWFGVTHIVTSETTTDFYNPKTIAASMGSFTKVSVASLPLEEFLKSAQTLRIPIIGALLNGKSLYESNLPKHGILVMGSESHGIHETLHPYITEKIMIPQYGKAESLNVGVATGIFLATFRNN
jgi:TrmH family RNA methyltransferase